MDNMLGTEKISVLFWKFGIPAVIAMLINASQTIIDGLFLGNFIDKYAMAAVSIVNPYLNLVTGVAFMVGIGSLSIIGRRLGAGEVKKAQDVFRSAQVVAGAMVTLIVILGILFPREIATILRADTELIEYSTVYLRISICFAPFFIFMIMFGLMSRMIEKPNQYLIATIISLVGNIILNTLFIAVFKWGIVGAALATGFSQVIAFIVVLIPMLNRNNKLNVFVGKINKASIPEMLYNGSSEAVVSMSAAVTTFLFNNAFMDMNGADGVASFTIINYIIVFGTMMMFGISDGIGSVISYNYGSNRHDRVRNIIKLSIISNVIVGVILYSIILVSGENLVGLFASENDSMEVIAIATKGAKIMAVMFLMSGISIVLSGYFTAIGKAKESIFIALSRGSIFILIGITILPMISEEHGIWLVMPFAEAATIIIGIVLVLRDGKLLERENKL